MTFTGLEDDFRGSFRWSFRRSLRWSWVWSKSINQSQSIRRIIKLLYVLVLREFGTFLRTSFRWSWDFFSLELGLIFAGVVTHFRWSWDSFSLELGPIFAVVFAEVFAGVENQVRWSSLLELFTRHKRYVYILMLN
jgi:hypothetical protein